jgi:hypothetical protein
MMEPGKALAMQVFSSLGFRAEEVPVSTGQTADLLVTDSESRYLVEVKDKEESEVLAAERREALSRDGVFDQSDPLKYNNSISSVFRKAQKQLISTPKTPDTFQLIWFYATGIDADAKYRQAFATFYGQVYLSALHPAKQETVGCFYFDYAASFEMPTVEALILTDGKNPQFCLNEFSHRAADFRESGLFKKFAELDAVVDPIAWAANGLIVPCGVTVARRNDDEILKAMKEQTGILYTVIRLTRYTSSVGVKPPTADE